MIYKNSVIIIVVYSHLKFLTKTSKINVKYIKVDSSTEHILVREIKIIYDKICTSNLKMFLISSILNEELNLRFQVIIIVLVYT